MSDFLTRSRRMLGDDAIEKLKKSHVLIFGLGGVGGHAAETLVRGGIGCVTLVDSERFDLSNCNRQIFATEKTVGFEKTLVAKERLETINPKCKINTETFFFGKDPCPIGLFDGVDYILDAIDTVSSKIQLIREADQRKIPIISCMGTGNKLDPTAFRVSDIYKTNTCPLARAVRSECKKIGIRRLKVVYSEELPHPSAICNENGRNVPGSVSFVPGVAGMILAGEIIKDLTGICLS